MSLPAELWVAVLLRTPQPWALSVTCRALSELFREHALAWFAAHVSFAVLRRLVSHIERRKDAPGLRRLLACVRRHRARRRLQGMLAALLPAMPMLRARLPHAAWERVLDAPRPKRVRLLGRRVAECVRRLRTEPAAARWHAQLREPCRGEYVRWPLRRLEALFVLCEWPLASGRMLDESRAVRIALERMPWAHLSSSEHVSLLQHTLIRRTLYRGAAHVPMLALRGRLNRQAALAWLDFQMMNAAFNAEMRDVLDPQFSDGPERARDFAFFVTACFELAVAAAVRFGAQASLVYVLCVPRHGDAATVSGDFIRHCMRRTACVDMYVVLRNFLWQHSPRRIESV